MQFKQLISALEKSSAGLLEHSLGSNPEIESGASLEKAKSHQISFLEKGNLLNKKLNSSNAGVVLLPQINELKEVANQKGLSWAILRNPRLAFAEILELLNPPRNYERSVHKTAVIANSVNMSDNIYIGANVYIGDNCKIGFNTLIHPGVVIYEDVIIGDNCELHANCVVHPKSRIGNSVIINSSAIIGSEGFGFVPTPSGWRKMPQTGIVVLENKVEIGSSSTVDRPAVGETRIKEGTKIDNLVQIGHGVTIGKNCAIAAQVGIAGGANIGDGVILAGQVGVGNRVNVSNGVIASSKCGIHADVPPNSVVSGFPAIPNRLWLKCSANFKKLPEIAKALRENSTNVN